MASMFTSSLQAMLIVKVKLRLILLEMIYVQIIEWSVLTEIYFKFMVIFWNILQICN